MKPRLLLILVLAGLLAALSLPGSAARGQKDEKPKDAKKDEPKKDEPKKDEPKKDEPKKDEPKKDEKPKDTKKDDVKKDDIKKDDKPKEDKNKKDKDALQGSWKVDKAEEDGKPVEELKGAKFTFKDDRVTVSFDNKESEPVELRMTLDANKTPRQIDFLDVKGDSKEAAPGIYDLTGDTLKLCVAEPTLKKRPTEFKSAEKMITYIELKREK
jgi:uncharacterized protein (TIGR03067 family)